MRNIFNKTLLAIHAVLCIASSISLVAVLINGDSRLCVLLLFTVMFSGLCIQALIERVSGYEESSAGDTVCFLCTFIAGLIATAIVVGTLL